MSLSGSGEVRAQKAPMGGDADPFALGEASAVIAHGMVPMPRDGASSASQAEHALLRRRQLSHDIRHELGMIMVLASLLVTEPDVGPVGREHARQLLGEARWLDRMQRAYEDVGSDAPMERSPAELIRIDVFASDMVAATKPSTPTKMTFTGQEAWAYVDRLAFWRALRNVINNAVRAAGPSGWVEVCVTSMGGWVVAQVDDDGPGFGAVQPGIASLGLGIAQEAVASCGGELRIRRGGLGGCCVLLRMPAAESPGANDPMPLHRRTQ